MSGLKSFYYLKNQILIKMITNYGFWYTIGIFHSFHRHHIIHHPSSIIHHPLSMAATPSPTPASILDGKQASNTLILKVNEQITSYINQSLISHGYTINKPSIAIVLVGGWMMDDGLWMMDDGWWIVDGGWWMMDDECGTRGEWGDG